MLIQKIKQDLVSHIKSGDKIKISITRLLIAALKDKEISLRNNQEFDDLINERVYTDGKWGSVDKALNEIEKLLDERNNKEDKAILVATKEQLLSMQK